MPARQPFTALCQLTVRGRQHGRADLHLHTTHSDGLYSPAQVIDLAKRSGLAAVAVTDHDTLAGVAPARVAAVGSGVEVISGVEISARHEQREVHLLAYFVDVSAEALQEALARVRRARAERFLAMVERLRGCGVSVDPGELPPSPGRRHLAELLVAAGKVAHVRQAFARFLKDGGPADVPKRGLPAEEALALVRDAGGVAGLAHPSYHCCRDDLAGLRKLGLGAVEAEYPGVKRSFSRQLRAWAADLGLAVTGGSDCHGPDSPAVGTCTVSAEELTALRQKAEGADGVSRSL
jgi:3',5'-nucleoside bisphosphate phosphatase